MSTDLDGKLTRLFDADRSMRQAQQAFSTSGDAKARLETLGRALDQADQLRDEEEAAARMMRLADLFAEEAGPEACRALVRLLGHGEPAVRAAAGEGLIEIGQSRYAEVARTFEQAIQDGKPVAALAEIPYILAELGEPGGVKLCASLLKHPEADVVASSVDALAALGDPSVVKDIEKLKTDPRKVSAESDGEVAELTLGDLATEAVEHLRSLHD